MANGDGQNNDSKSSSFNDKSNQPRSESYSLTGGYMKQASSNEIKRNLREVEAAYIKNKIEETEILKTQRAEYLRGQPSTNMGLGIHETNKNKKPNQQEIADFDERQKKYMQGVQMKWEQKAKLASEGKEWRDSDQSQKQESDREYRARLKAHFQAKRGREQDKDKGRK